MTEMERLQAENTKLKREALQHQKRPQIIEALKAAGFVVSEETPAILEHFIGTLDLSVNDDSLAAKIKNTAPQFFATSKQAGTGATGPDGFELPEDDEDYFRRFTAIEDAEKRKRYRDFVLAGKAAKA